MASGDFELKLDLAPIVRNTTQLGAKTDRAIAGTMERYDGLIEGWMRTHAPWTDRTGNARNGLFAQAGHRARRSHWIDLGHRVPYGIWLEITRAGRYAVVLPALLRFQPMIMRSIDRLWGRLGGGGV